jgi:hypothetical protein
LSASVALRLRRGLDRDAVALTDRPIAFVKRDEVATWAAVEGVDRALRGPIACVVALGDEGCGLAERA